MNGIVRAGIADSPRQQELLQQIRRLEPLAKVSEQVALSEAKNQLYRNNVAIASELLAREVREGRETGDEATRIKARIAELEPFITENNPYPTYGNLSDAYTNLAAQQGMEYLRARAQGENQNVDALLERIKANVKSAQLYTDSRYRKNVDMDSILARSWSGLAAQATRSLAKEVAAKRENSPAANAARDLITKAKAGGATRDYYNDYWLTNAWKGRAHETAYRIIEAERNGDAKTVEALQTQLQIEVEKADETPLDAYIEWEKSRIKRGEPIITSENYALRPGDPLISVSAPATCQRVVAILPSGELLPLVYDADKGAWQARFDVPNHASEGDYRVQIIIVAADGARHNLTMNFRVDTTAPDGKGGVKFGDGAINLRLESDEQTDRVSAFTPWNVRVELLRDASGSFGARAEVPLEWRDKTAVVRFVLTDKAHNRTEIMFDWNG